MIGLEAYAGGNLGIGKLEIWRLGKGVGFLVTLLLERGGCFSGMSLWSLLLALLAAVVAAAAVAAKLTMVNFRDRAVTIAVGEEWVCSIVRGDNRIVLDVLGCFIVEDLGCYRCFA